MSKKISVILLSILLVGCNNKSENSMSDSKSISLMVLDPGHFHASLVQKQMYPGVDSKVYIYAPEGMELNDYLQRVESYNSREESPTSWELEVYTGDDFLERMLKDKPGNLVVLAGNNQHKTEYIDACIDAGIHVLSDKPMAINQSDFKLLKSTYIKAEAKGLLIYDIMTERFEATNILQKVLSEQEYIFGELITGSQEEPAITKESVHHFFKYVSGKPLQRPDWFFDVEQEGEAIADVGTHLVDLVLWEAFPEGIKNYKEDINILSSKSWTTKLSDVQFRKVTGLDSFPDFLDRYIREDTLFAVANSSVDYTVNGYHAKVSVEWAFQAPEGAGDTHYSIMRGSISDLIIQQGPQENYRPELYIFVKDRKHHEVVRTQLQLLLKADLNERFPGIALEAVGEEGWRLNIPNKYRKGHESHFAMVTEKFLEYFESGKIPQWEVDQTYAKYHTTTSAVEFVN
jgi:predicted dehydrogenase